MITKILVSAGITLGSIVGAATAGADPNPSGNQPNPFGSLTSSSHETAPVGAGVREELHRGIWAGLSGG
jgi:hypothetical protein